MESKIILRIGNKYLIDFNTDTVSVNFNLKDIKEYSKKKTSFTKPIQIWQSKDTASIFKAAFNINSQGGFDERKKIEAEILEDGVPILKGYLYLENIYKEYYEVVLAAADVDIFTAAGDKELSDLDFGTLYQHYITKQHILDQWNAPGAIDGKGIKYTLIDYNDSINYAYGTGQGSDLNQDYSLTPAVGAFELFEKIMADQGYTYEVSADILNNFKHLYIPYNGGLSKWVTSYNYLKAHTTKTRSANNRVNLVFETGDFEYLSNDTSTGTINIKSTGNYKFQFTFTGRVSTGTGSLDINLKQFGSAYNTFDASESIDLTTSNTTTIVTVECFVEQLDTLQIELLCPDLVISSCEVVGYLKEYLYAGTAQISLNDVLPVGYKQKDFLNDLFKLFNLYTQVDKEDNKKLHLRTYAEFYRSPKRLDWTEKINAKSISFKDLSCELAKNYEFSFSEDSDIYNKDYKERRNKTLYSNTVSGTNELIGDTTENIKISTSPVAMKSVNETSLKAIPLILDKSGKREWKARMLFLNIWDQTPVNYNKVFVTRTDTPTWNNISNIISLSHFRDTDLGSTGNLFLGFDHSDDYLKLSGDPVLSNSTLYNKYYKQDIEGNLYGEYKILKASFNLNNFDVNPENFRNVIYIKDKKIGSAYYRLNSIKNYRPGQLCEVELIKVNTYPISYNSIINPNILTLLTHNAEEAASGGSSSGGGGGGNVDLSSYYTKPEVNTLLDGKADADLSAYTRRDTAETITPQWNFNQGVKLKNSKTITVDASGNVVISGRIIVNGDIEAQGNITAFSAGLTPASWWDELGSHVDGTTIVYNSTTGKLEVIGGGGGVDAETDPVFTASAAYGVTTAKITNWDTAHSWGNHAGLYLKKTVDDSTTFALGAGRLHAGYDSAQTGSVSCSNWFRSSGNTGWFNATHSGGIYMTDATWIRTYNNKGFYCNAEMRGNYLYSETSVYSAGGLFRCAAGDGNGIRFWDSDNYKIYMSAIGNANWGGRLDTTSDYNMYFRMLGGTNRGFVFRNGTTNVAQIDGAGNISTIGNNLIVRTPQTLQEGCISVGESTPLSGTACTVMSYRGDGYGWLGMGSISGGVPSKWVMRMFYTSQNAYFAGEVTAYSDRRKKENIKPILNATEIVKGLQGVRYNRIDLGEEENKKIRVGVIAQEVQKVLPEVVHHLKDTDEYSVDYSKIVSVLIESQKELIKEIEELKKKISNG